MSALSGARVALLEARLASELAELVRREGGEPVCAPAVAEEPVDVTALIPVLIDDITAGRCEFVVFLTGAGLTSLLDQAEQTGQLAAIIGAFSRATTVCRGPKPAAVLRRYGIPVRVNARAAHDGRPARGAPRRHGERQGVVLLHDGGGNLALVDELRRRGAWVEEIRAYDWRLPADIAPIESLVEELIEGRVDAIAFTSQVQIRHLIEIGTRMNRSAALLHALRHRTVVGSIGPTCSRALTDVGAPPHVVASPPRMRPLVTAVGEYLSTRQPHATNQDTP